MNPRLSNPQSSNLPPIRNPQSAIRNLTLLPAATLLLLSAGCWDNTPPPPRVPVPAPQSYQSQPEPPRPLANPSAAAAYPADASASAPMPYYDEPLVNQRPPEQQRFVQLYNQVGRPRIVLFVNRTLEGHLIPSSAGDALPPSSPIPGLPSDRTHERQPTYLAPGQYDEANARSIDYQAVENIMTDWLAANGQTTITSPTLARQRLSDETIKEMQAGRPQVLAEIAQQLSADVLVQVVARPTRQTPQGLEIRLVSEAMNIKGGQSIARAVVDIPPPLDKSQINKYTRYLARKLMDDMASTWSAPPPADMRRPDQPATPTTPTAPTTPNAPTTPITPTTPTAPATPPTTPIAPTAPEAPKPQ